MIAVAVDIISGSPDRSDRVGISAMVAQRVALGPRRLAEHVKGIEIAFSRDITPGAHRLVDGTAEHELLAHFPHRCRHDFADHRLSQSPYHAAQGTFESAVSVVEYLSSHQERSWRGVDKHQAEPTGMERQIVRPCRCM